MQISSQKSQKPISDSAHGTTNHSTCLTNVGVVSCRVSLGECLMLEYKSNLSIITIRLDGRDVSILKYVSAIIDEPLNYISNYSYNSTVCFKEILDSDISVHLFKSSMNVYEPNSNIRVEWIKENAIIYIKGFISRETIIDLLQGIKPLKKRSNSLRPKSWPGTNPISTKHSSSPIECSVIKIESKTMSSRFASLESRSEKSISKNPSYPDTNSEIRMRIYWLIDNEIGSCNRLSFSIRLKPYLIKRFKFDSEESLDTTLHDSAKKELHFYKDEVSTMIDSPTSAPEITELVSDKLHLPLPLSKMFLLVTKDYDFNGFEILSNERTMTPLILATDEAVERLLRHLKKALNKFSYW